MSELKVISEKQKESLKRVSAVEHYHIAYHADESDAQAMMEALFDKFPGLYMKIATQRVIKDRATIEAMKGFMEKRSEYERR